MRGTPQVHQLGGRTVHLLPLFHPAAALRTTSVKEQLRGDFATIPALLEKPLPEPMPSAAEIAAEEDRGETAERPADAPADQLELLRRPERGLMTDAAHRKRRSAAETEAIGARARRAARLPAMSVVRLG